MRIMYLLVSMLLPQVFLWSGNILLAGEKILFISDKDELANWDIYSMNVDGSVITRLTDSTSIENHADVSPDGTTVVFSSNATGNFEIYKAPLANLKDENAWVQLTTFSCTDTICTPGRHPHWSPDGAKIIYTAKDGCKLPGKIVSQCSVPIPPDCVVNGEPGIPFEKLHLMNSDGTNDTVLDVQGMDYRIVHVGHPSFSPDGRRIVFTASINKNATNWEVFTVDWNGSAISNLRQITRGSTYPPNPNPIKMTGGATFSLDGKWIYCSSTRTTMGNSQLFRIPAHAKNPVKLSDKHRKTWTCGNDYVPTPVPGNNSQEKIVFNSDGTDIINGSGPPEWDLDICVLNPDGSGRTNLTGNQFPSEMLLIADEVSWFCGLPPNLRDCKFTLREVSIKSKFYMVFSENLPDDFPNKEKYPIYMQEAGNWLATHYPAYLETIQRWLQEYMLPGADVHTAYRQIVIPSMMPVVEGCSDCVDILTEHLPNGKTQKWYRVKLEANQEVSHWKIIAGKLPEGLQLKGEKGIISGYPKEKGIFSFSTAAIRKDGNADSKDMSIKVR